MMAREGMILVALYAMFLASEQAQGLRVRGKLKEEKKKLQNYECSKVCPSGRRCALEDSKEVCVCLSFCPSRHKPVCGSDGRKYENHCELHRTACITNTKISIDWSNKCIGKEVPEPCPRDKLVTLMAKIITHFKNELQTQVPQKSLILRLFRRRDKNDDTKIDHVELTSLLADYTMYEDMYAILAACSVRDWINAEDVNGDHVLELGEFYSQYERSKHVNKEMSTQESARIDDARPTATTHEHQTSGYPTPLVVEIFTEKLREPMAAEHFTEPRHTVDSTAGSPAVKARHSNLFFAFGSDGIHVINPATLSLVRHIRAVDVVNGSQSPICTGSPEQPCTWGGAVNAGNQLIYAADALGRRLIVIDIATFSVIEEIPVCGHPYNPQYVAALDELWFTNWAESIQVLTEEEDDNGTVNVVTMATKKNPHSVTLVPLSESQTSIYGLHVVDSCHLRDEENFGYVTHLNKPGFHELSLKDKEFTRFVNLSSHNCHGTYAFAFSSSTGHAVVHCFTAQDGGQRAELVVDLKTQEVVAMTSVNIGIPHISPDGRFVVTFNDYTLSTLFFAYDGTIQIGVPMKSSMRLSDVAFFSRNDGYDFYVTTKDSSSAILLHTSPAGMETLNVLTDTGMAQKVKDWLHTRRSIATGCEAYDRYLATPATAEDAVVILDGQQQSVSGRVEHVKGAVNLVWVGGEEN